MSTRNEELFQVQLGLLVEAGGRVQTAVGKVFHWGLSATDVASGQSNREALLHDLDDLKVAVRRIETVLAPTSVTFNPASGLPTPEATAVEVAPANGQ
jgi:hypothetical protein